jgi:hypothetical protein
VKFEVLKMHHVQNLYFRSSLPTNICLRLKNQVHVIYDAFAFSCFTLSDYFAHRTDVTYQGTANPSNDIPIIDQRWPYLVMPELEVRSCSLYKATLRQQMERKQELFLIRGAQFFKPARTVSTSHPARVPPLRLPHLSNLD